MKIEIAVFSVMALIGWLYLKKVDRAWNQISELISPQIKAAIVTSERVTRLEKNMEDLNEKSDAMQAGLSEIIRRLESAGIR